MKIKHIGKENLLARYNCGPIKLSGVSDAFYERHVTFDQVVSDTETTARDIYLTHGGAEKMTLNDWIMAEEELSRKLGMSSHQPIAT